MQIKLFFKSLIVIVVISHFSNFASGWSIAYEHYIMPTSLLHSIFSLSTPYYTTFIDHTIKKLGGKCYVNIFLSRVFFPMSMTIATDFIKGERGPMNLFAQSILSLPVELERLKLLLTEPNVP